MVFNGVKYQGDFQKGMYVSKLCLLQCHAVIDGDRCMSVFKCLCCRLSGCFFAGQNVCFAATRSSVVSGACPPLVTATSPRCCLLVWLTLNKAGNTLGRLNKRYKRRGGCGYSLLSEHHPLFKWMRAERATETVKSSHIGGNGGIDVYMYPSVYALCHPPSNGGDGQGGWGEERRVRVGVTTHLACMHPGV